MGFDDLSTALLISFLMTLAINWIYFFNWIGLIGKLVHLMNPKNTNKEIEENSKIVKQKAYITHQRKWKLIFLVIPFAFSCLLIVWVLLIKDFVVSYFLTFAIIIALYCILSKNERRERRERKIVLQCIVDKTYMKEDDSMS